MAGQDFIYCFLHFCFLMNHSIIKPIYAIFEYLLSFSHQSHSLFLVFIESMPPHSMKLSCAFQNFDFLTDYFLHFSATDTKIQHFSN